ncbi:exonuclease SbcCD subunit D C-terminal domain-containing protein [Bacteroides fragilis]|jgi:exonuclease sbcCD, D subunit|uniref:exonuclease SbcCD subunit D n=1 Tax=Bacteroides fragilis TaxID=817 RepID=UPI0015F6CA82|nr:exonuclease SbcCD subunit D C-terminal domain-containing protein [Bacteroides fragilis]MBA5649814.1 exonuclease SbcCD subunit D C-terminal domain-containing protein [Bacteroides fragilis]MCE9400510.1 exonuclease SbcCD subunit D C-terminal domain-containing protein [Bacteroides fragilis]MCE9469744.1 exonuclease SbcCD subunit D C-terminal domain-containing protein [Bacteroides fragilis]
MIRILHTADWHLGQTFFGYDRTQEHEHFLDWLAGVLTKNKIDVLIVAGDVFDVSNPSAASQRMFYRFIHRVTTENPRLQLVVVAGNHDSAARLESPLPLLQEMRTEIKGIVRKQNGKIDYEHLLVELKNAAGEVEALCLAVPFLRQGDYPVVETEGNPYAEGVKELYARLLKYALKKRTDGQALVAVGHLLATGSEIAEKDHSERIIIGGLESVSPESFPEQIVYTALGHIHKAQRVSGRENIRYAGSPLPMSFAEKHYHHGVVKVTLDEGWAVEIEKLEYTPLVRLLSIPATEAAAPDEVLDELSGLELPEDEPMPYLEVKVKLSEPEPMLRQQVEEILEGKPVRLARIVSFYRQAAEGSVEEEVLTAGLQEMNPLQIVKATFENSYQTEMPEELVNLFQEACRTINLE